MMTSDARKRRDEARAKFNGGIDNGETQRAEVERVQAILVAHSHYPGDSRCACGHPIKVSGSGEHERHQAEMLRTAHDTVLAQLAEAVGRVVCSTCSGTGQGVGQLPDGRLMETDCSDCDGSGGEWWAIDEAIHSGTETRSMRADLHTLAAVVRDTIAAYTEGATHE